MGHEESGAVDVVQVTPLQQFPGGKGDGVDQYVQAVPMIRQAIKKGLYLVVTGDIAGQGNIRIDLCSEFFHAFPQFPILVGECQVGAFTVHCLGNTPGNGTIACHAYDQCTLAV